MLEFNLRFPLLSFLFIISTYFVPQAQSKCTRGCDLALASYYVQNGTDLTSISNHFNTTINNILKYNPTTIPNQDSLPSSVRINVPFTCDCIKTSKGEYLGHVFSYEVKSGDTYIKIAQDKYANLTTAELVHSDNNYDPTRIPVNVNLKVIVNCSCGDSSVSKDYGLFVTYPLQPGESLNKVSSLMNLSADLIRSYNPGVNFELGTGLVYIPGRG